MISRHVLFFFVCFVIYTGRVCSQDTAYSVRRGLKLDLVSIYDDFFDSKVQARAAIGYERCFSKWWTWGVILDGGQYDKYTYYKYYDFFNQGPGLYSERQDVRISGFHLIPEVNRCFNFPVAWKYIHWRLGGQMDYSFYSKHVRYVHGLNGSSYSERIYQNRMGLGLQSGCIFTRWSPFLIALRTTFSRKIFNLHPSGSEEIRALHSFWNSEDNLYWWNYSIYLVYAF